MASVHDCAQVGRFTNLFCFEHPRLWPSGILRLPPGTAVRQDELVSDCTVDRIYELTDRLEERLHDSVYLRERLTKAHDANQWPNLEGAVARVACRRRSSDIR